jgi:hypothetical protein
MTQFSHPTSALENYTQDHSDLFKDKRLFTSFQAIITGILGGGTTRIACKVKRNPVSTVSRVDTVFDLRSAYGFLGSSVNHFCGCGQRLEAVRVRSGTGARGSGWRCRSWCCLWCPNLCPNHNPDPAFSSLTFYTSAVRIPSFLILYTWTMELGGLRIHGHQTSLLILEGKLEGAFRDRRQQQVNVRTGIEARRRKPPERFAGLIGSGRVWVSTGYITLEAKDTSRWPKGAEMLLNLEGIEMQLVHLRNRETGRTDTQSWTFHALMLPTPRQIMMLEKRKLVVDPRALENPLFAFLTNLSDPESLGHQAVMIKPGA